CQLGGTVATNASGSRSFKYGSTRKFVKRIEIVLPTGEILNLKRGEVFSSGEESNEIITNSGKTFRVKLPTYNQPNTRKNTSGYFAAADKIDAIDLFIG